MPTINGKIYWLPESKKPSNVRSSARCRCCGDKLLVQLDVLKQKVRIEGKQAKHVGKYGKRVSRFFCHGCGMPVELGLGVMPSELKVS